MCRTKRCSLDTTRHIHPCLVFILPFTCALRSSGAAIGLPVWLLSYYQAEVVSCLLCMISDSVNQKPAVSLALTHTVCVWVRRMFTPVHSSSWISLWAFTKYCRYGVRRQSWCLYVASFLESLVCYCWDDEKARPVTVCVNIEMSRFVFVHVGPMIFG